MELATCTLMVRDMPLDEWIPLVRDAGFTLIERSKRTCGDPKKLERAGLEVHAVHAGCGPDGLFSSNPAEREKALEPVFADLADAARFNPKRYVFHWIYREPGRPRLEHWRQSVGRIVNECAKKGIVCAMETVPHKPLNPAQYVWTEEVFDMMRSFGSEWAKVNLDLNHSNLRESLPDVIRSAGDLLETTHVSDNHGEAEGHLMPGEGVIDFDAVVSALVEIGYRGPYNFEVHANGVEPGPFLAQLYSYAHDLLKRSGAL